MRAGKRRVLVGFLLLLAIIAGCEEKVTPVTGSPVLDNQLAENAKAGLEQRRSALPALYKKEAQNKDWDSAHQVAVTLLGCLGNQTILKERGVAFTPVTTRQEALGWAELALSRASTPAKGSLPGSHDEVNVRKMLTRTLDAVRKSRE